MLKALGTTSLLFLLITLTVVWVIGLLYTLKFGVIWAGLYIFLSIFIVVSLVE